MAKTSSILKRKQRHCKLWKKLIENQTKSSVRMRLEGSGKVPIVPTLNFTLLGSRAEAAVINGESETPGGRAPKMGGGRGLSVKELDRAAK
jgi:hypothetical protein